MTDVPGGVAVWALPWHKMLAAELMWAAQQPGLPPDGVLLHRKDKSSADDRLVYDVRCRQVTKSPYYQLYFCSTYQ